MSRIPPRHSAHYAGGAARPANPAAKPAKEKAAPAIMGYMQSPAATAEVLTAPPATVGGRPARRKALKLVNPVEKPEPEPEPVQVANPATWTTTSPRGKVFSLHRYLSLAKAQAVLKIASHCAAGHAQCGPWPKGPCTRALRTHGE